MANYGPPGSDHPEPWRGRQPEEPYGHPGDPRDRSGRDDPTGVLPAAQGYPPAGPDSWGYPPAGADPGHPYPYGGVSPAEGAYRNAAYPPPGAYAPEPPPGGPAYLSNGPGAVPGEPPPPPGRPARPGRTLPVLAVLAVLVLGGGAALFFLAGSDDAAPDTAFPTVTAVPPSDAPDAATSESADVSPSALAPESTADPRFARVGQCVRNEGPAGGRPKLLITGCGSRTYEVLQRFDGMTSGEKDAEAKCATVDGYTDWYFYNSELDTLDFVLCLKLR